MGALLNVVVVAGIVITLLTGIPVWRQMRSHPRGLKVLFFAECGSDSPTTACAAF
jgi:POT family proton-dependent oligopeptide transporter